MDLVAAAEGVAGVVRANADEAEQLRRLPAATVDALVAAGLMRMYVPAAYGGPEVDPPTALQAMEAVAVADAAAGWCTMIAATTSSLAVFLPPAAARRDLRRSGGRDGWRVRAERHRPGRRRRR